MRVETLLSPGLLSNGYVLRREAAKAISAVEIVAGRTPGGKTKTAASLGAFFTDCASKVASLADVTAPTVVSAVVSGDPGEEVVTITFSEALDTTVVPAKTDFVFTPARVVSSVTVSGLTVVVAAEDAVATDSLTYTKPAVNALRDRAGNQVATFTEVVA